MMATRSGDLDPGVLIYLMREHGMDAGALENLVNRRSGLLGVSNRSGDLRALRESPDAAATLAVAMFARSVAKGVVAMMAALGGADLLVFTGGVGEHDASTRDEVVGSLGWAGVGGRCAVRALPSREDEEIARISRGLVE